MKNSLSVFVQVDRQTSSQGSGRWLARTNTEQGRWPRVVLTLQHDF